MFFWLYEGNLFLEGTADFLRERDGRVGRCRGSI
jgi:hypothetical protein